MSIPDLKSPAAKAESRENNQQQQSAMMWILTGTIICLILVIVILLLRPEQNQSAKQHTLTEKNQTELIQSEKKQQVITQNKSNKDDKETNDIDKSNKNYTYNEQTEIEWFLKKTQADNEQLKIWSEETYKKAMELEKQALQDKKDQKFKLAEGQFQQAIELIEQSLNNKQTIKSSLLQETEQLLTKNKTEQAKQILEKARVIDPQDKKIDELMQRIIQRPQVLELEEQAVRYEQDSNKQDALELYKKILDLDKQYIKAQKKVAELTRQIKDDQFKKIIGQLIVALDENNIKKAQLLFSQAQSIYPEDAVLAELQQRLNQQKKTATIVKNLKQAEYYQHSEQWNKALKAYKAVLKADPNSSNALLNIERVKKYIKINQSLDKIIQYPDRLQEDKVLDNSRAILAFVKDQLKHKNSLLYPLSRTPELKQKLIKTENIIQSASQIINVQLISDNKTEVVIYKVGKFGKFENREIKLRPGLYTIVGSRDGFKDYRKKIRISPDKNNVSIVIVSKEQI